MFADTKAYADLGEKIISTITTPFTKEIQQNTQQIPVDEIKERARAGAAARSPYYGLYFTSISAIGTIWLLGAIQAFIAAKILFLSGNITPFKIASHPLRIIIPLSLLSTLPFFTALAMPDLFASLGTLAVVLLILGSEKLSHRDSFFLAFIGLASVIFHSTHAIIITSVSIIAACLKSKCFPESTKRSICFIPIAIIFSAFAAQQFYNYMAIKMTGGPIYRPPFLTARLLEDGGLTFLPFLCSKDTNFAVCKFTDKDLTDSQAFLWEQGTIRSVFADASPEDRIKLAQQDFAFAIEVFKHDPVKVIQSSIRNSLILFFQSRLDDIGDGSAIYKDLNFQRLSKYDLNPTYCTIHPENCAPKINLIILGYLYLAVSLAAFAYVFYSLIVNGLNHIVHKFTFCLVSSVFINDLICATLSGPYPRYHTRMSWLLLFAAILCASFARSENFKKRNL